jgi:biotin synthase
VRSDEELSRAEAVARIKQLADDGANAVGVMATADFPIERFLEVGRAARSVLPHDFPLAANLADFGTTEAKALLEAGFTAVYHVIRLREGVDSPIPPEKRRQTCLAARAVGLDVTYCVEPIGPEHTPAELVEAMFRAEEFTPTSMATMRRVSVPGTPLAERGQISEIEQAKIQAVTTLVAAHWSNLMMMGAHEPSMLFLRTGANRMTAETGVNPRDTAKETATSRGRSVVECARMIREAGFTLRQGPSPALQGPLRK